MSAPSPAQTFGHYTLLEELGRGGQGTVWLAEDHNLKRKVALKLLRTAAGTIDEHQLERFRREAEAASKLDHPNICALFDAGDVDGVPYLAFRHIEGETLAERVTDAQVSDSASASATSKEGIQTTVALFEKLARALHKAHEQGLIHRDVKPGNVMVTPDGEPIVLDFGLARDELADEQTLTHSGDLLGTPAYMSPEQLMANRVPLDRRTDVYSLGATLYECLTLQRPFGAPTRAELYQKILHSDPSSVGSTNRQIPRDLQVIVETAMEKDRNRRYQTAANLAEDLRRFREFEPIRARPIGRALRLKRWAQRHPALATGGVLVNVALVASLTMLVMVLESRAEAEASARAAQDTLAAAFLEKADRAITDGDHGAAAIFAAAALVEDPNNPQGPHYRPLADPDPADERQVEERIALMYSRHYEAEAGRRLRLLRSLRPPGPLRSAGAFAFSPTEPSIAVGTLEGDVCVWALQPAGAPEILRGSRPMLSRRDGLLAIGRCSDLLYSPNGRWLAQIVAGGLQLWDSRTKRIVHSPALERQPTALAYLGADELAIGDTSGWVGIWSIPDGRVRTERQFPSHILALCYSQFHQLLAVSPVAEQASLVGRDLQQDRTIDIPKHALDFVFAPDGSSLTMAVADNAVWQFGLASQKAPFRLATPFRPEAVDYSPDAKYLVHGGAFGEAYLRDTRESTTLDRAHGPVAGARLVRFAPDGEHLAVAGFDQDVRLWRVGTSTQRSRRAAHSAPFSGLAISRDGGTVVTAGLNDGLVLRWDLQRHRGLDSAVVTKLRAPTAAGQSPYLVQMSADARYVAISTLKGQVDLRDLSTGEIERLRDGSATIRYGAWQSCFGPGEPTLFLPEENGRVHRWDLTTMQFLEPPLMFGHTHVNTVAVSSSGELLAAGCQDGSVHIGRPTPGGATTVIHAHAGLVSGLAFAPDSREIATSGLDAVIRIWSLDTGAKTRELTGHGDWVNNISYSPDGRLLLSASDDNTVRLWSLEDARVLHVFRCADQAMTAEFAPDGRHFFMNDGVYLTRYRVTVDERIGDPRELLRAAERAAGVRLEGLELVPLK